MIRSPGANTGTPSLFLLEAIFSSSSGPPPPNFFFTRQLFLPAPSLSFQFVSLAGECSVFSAVPLTWKGKTRETETTGNKETETTGREVLWETGRRGRKKLLGGEETERMAVKQETFPE